MKYTIKPEPEKFGNNFMNVLTNFTFVIRYHYEYRKKLNFKIFLASYHIDTDSKNYRLSTKSFISTYFKLQNIRNEYNHYEIHSDLFREKGTDRTKQELKLAEIFLDSPYQVVDNIFIEVNKRERALKALPLLFEPLHAEIEFIFSKRQFRDKVVEWFNADRLS